ncbi:MAG: NAD-dependent epimerase/dehydratase family protein [Pseudonocardiales bacterium]|nr:NAD-dependent epimerase/dehydratase family protein [Pseudonocardiales bacterium]
MVHHSGGYPRHNEPARSAGLVTGARGFIGHRLVRRLVSGGTEVHAISRRDLARAGDVTWWQLNLTDPDATRRLVRSVRPDVGVPSGQHRDGGARP